MSWLFSSIDKYQKFIPWFFKKTPVSDDELNFIPTDIKWKFVDLVVNGKIPEFNLTIILIGLVTILIFVSTLSMFKTMLYGFLKFLSGIIQIIIAIAIYHYVYHVIEKTIT